MAALELLFCLADKVTQRTQQAGLVLPQLEASYVYGHSFMTPILFVTCRCSSNARAGEPTGSDKRDWSTECIQMCVPVSHPSRLKNNFVLTLSVLSLLIICAFLSDTTLPSSLRVDVKVLNCAYQQESSSQ